METGTTLHSGSCKLLSADRFLILLISLGVCHILVSLFASPKEEQCLTYMSQIYASKRQAIIFCTHLGKSDTVLLTDDKRAL
jgi:hypothetical protein